MELYRPRSIEKYPNYYSTILTLFDIKIKFKFIIKTIF